VQTLDGAQFVHFPNMETPASLQLAQETSRGLADGQLATLQRKKSKYMKIIKILYQNEVLVVPSLQFAF